MESPSPAKHFRYLDGLRAAAAIFVVIHHALLQIDFTHQPLIGLQKLIYIFIYGRYAVDLFIVISGFCLMLPVAKGDGTIRGGAIYFFKRRAWRILPTYYFAMALSLLLIWLLVNKKTGTHWDISIPVTEKSFFTHIFLIHDVFGNDFNINHAFWSIAVEWRIYFLFPVLVLSWRKLGPILTTIMALLFSYILFELCNRIIGSSLNAHYIGLFTMGMLGASIVFSCNNSLCRLRSLSWGYITVFMTVIIILISPNYDEPFRQELYIVKDYFVGLWSMSFLIMISFEDRNWISRFLSCNLMTFIGTFSYSIYLIHAPLLQIFWQYLFSPFKAQPWLMFASLSIFGTPAIIGLSYIFFLACEQPFISKRKKILA